MSPGNLRTTMHYKIFTHKNTLKKNPYKFLSTGYHTNWPEMSLSVSGYKGILCLEKLACSNKKKCHHVWKTVETIFKCIIDLKSHTAFSRSFSTFQDLFSCNLSTNIEIKIKMWY